MISGGTQLRQLRLINSRQKEKHAKPRNNHIPVKNILTKESLLKKPKATKNAVAKPAVQTAEKKKPPSYCCINPACRKLFPDPYGTHADGATCSKVCEDIVDPVSRAFREMKRRNTFSSISV